MSLFIPAPVYIAVLWPLLLILYFFTILQLVPVSKSSNITLFKVAHCARFLVYKYDIHLNWLKNVTKTSCRMKCELLCRARSSSVESSLRLIKMKSSLQTNAWAAFLIVKKWFRWPCHDGSLEVYAGIIQKSTEHAYFFSFLVNVGSLISFRYTIVQNLVCYSLAHLV